MSTETHGTAPRFTVLSRILHWTMAVMTIAQLLIGVTMVASLAYYPLLLAVHRPLGTAILVLAVIRLINRLTHCPPPFLPSMGSAERRIATLSEYLMYALLLVQPVVGWAMLSAAHNPIRIAGPVDLPGIAPRNITVYAVLHASHTVLAAVLFLAITAHACAILFHNFVLRDHILDRMALWPRSRGARRD